MKYTSLHIRLYYFYFYFRIYFQSKSDTTNKEKGVEKA